MARARRWPEMACVFVGCLAVSSSRPARAQDVPEGFRAAVQKLLAGDASDPQGQQDDSTREDDPGEPVGLADATVEIAANGTVTLNVVDLPLATVLRVLSLETNRNIIATPAVQGTVTASLHNVTFEEALDAILISNQAAYRTVGKFIYVYTQEELIEIIAAENPPESRVFRLNYVPAEDIRTAIEPLLSAIGQVAVSVAPQTGIAPSSDEAGGASLASPDYVVVYDRPEYLEAIADVIAELDVRPRQVLVEATILSAKLNDDNALGIDFTVLGGVDLELMGSRSPAIQSLAVGDLPTARFELFNANVTTDFTGNVPAGGISIGVLRDQVALFVRALERITDTVVLANPKVLALNKQKAQVIVGRRDGYITTTVTETQAIQTVEFLDTGTQLLFRPFIGEDGFVRMELHPEDSVGGLNAANLPAEQTTEVTTNVIVKDGQTILIGGLFREVGTDTRAQVPLVGDIPVLGSVFQSRNDSTERQEVIILLTVHIVKDLDAYAQHSAEQFEDVERLRVGLRRGQMWHGRERLAQALYKRALEYYAGGEYDDALWHVRMALHNSPRFASAIKLQEDLRDRREWDDEGTTTRDFIHRAIMKQRGLIEPMFDRPAPPFVRPEMLQGPAGFEEQDLSTEEAHVPG